MHALLLAISNQVGGTGSGFFLAHKDFRGRFDVSFLTCAPPPLLQVEISSRTAIQLFLGQDQSTVAQRAETVAECFLTSKEI